jgi:hypothetical protein
LSGPQELTFLDYALHVIQPPTYPLYAGLVTSFFDRSTSAFNLKVEDDVVTSHEYFSRLAIQKCLRALTVLSENKELETYKRRQLHFVYAQTIRNALRSPWKASNHASQTNLEVISQLETIVTDNLSKGRTLADLIELNELLRIQVHEQILNAYAHLDPVHVHDSLPHNSKEITKEEYNCIRSVLHFDRDYSKLENYTNKVKSNFKDTHHVAKHDHSQDSPLKVLNIEDPNRKALLVRAILEGKNVDSKLVFSTGSPWDVYLKTYIEDSTLSNSDPGSDPFRKVFEMFRERTKTLGQWSTNNNLYAESKLGRITSGFGVKFTRQVTDKLPKPLR